MVKRLVISHSDDDQDIALEVRAQLLQAGYEVWIAHVNIKGSVNWAQSILDAIDSCDGLVLIWSESAVKSRDVREEIRIARVFLKPVFPFLAHPMKRIPALPEEINTLQVIQAGDFPSNIADLNARLADPQRNNIAYADLYAKDKNVFIAKAPNPNFVGRHRELKELFVDSWGYSGTTKLGYPIAISGLAGIGKTQLALAFGYRFKFFFPDGVYWIDTSNGIIHELSKIGRHMLVNRFEDEREADHAVRVYEKLCQMSGGLIIFDNVTDLAEFRKWCPEGSLSCSVIFTTRMSPRGFTTRVMHLTELDSNSAFELIISRREDRNEIASNEVQRQALQEICRVMGNHPLALEQCAAHLQSGFIQPTDFLQDIQADPLGRLADQAQFEEFLGIGNPDLLEVLRLNYTRLEKKLVDPYFLLMCCFGPHGINEELLVNAYGEPAKARRALDQLSAISLIRHEPPNTIALHPLVALFGRALQKTGNVDYTIKFVDVMLGFLRAHEHNLASEAVRREKPHIDEALRIAKDCGLWDSYVQIQEYVADMEGGIQERIESLEKAYQIIEQHLPQQKRKLPSLRLRLGKAHRTAGRLHEAVVDLNKAEVLYREIEEVDSAWEASLRFELGDIRLALGQYAEAEKTLSDALKVASIDLDNSAPEVMQLRQALAKHALYLGDYDTAEAGFTEILGYRRIFYTAQPDAVSAAGLASIYTDLSRLALARAHYIDAIEIAKDALTIIKQYHNESDPVCSQLYLLLGIIHYESGDYSMAEQQIDKARGDFLTTFGESHPNYARALVALSDVHRKQGKFDKAETEVERAITIFEHVYGKEHPFVAGALEVKVKIFHHLGERVEAKLLIDRSLEIRRKAYGEDHPDVSRSVHDLGSYYLRLGQYAEAIKQFERARQITAAVFGETHPDYVERTLNLAIARYMEGEYRLALDLVEAIKAALPSGNHYLTARWLQLMSELHRRIGQFNIAMDYIDRAITMKKAIYGTEEHPSVAEALEVKIKIFHHLGERIEAKLLIERTLEIRRKAYRTTENHPEVSRSLHDLGSYYLRLGQFEAAAEQFERARQITAAVFGEHHPDYVERTLNLANARNKQGEYKQALKLVAEVEQALPSGNHYLTARWLQLMGELQRRIGQFNKAMDYIDQAIMMKKAIYGTEEHPSVAEALEVQAKICDHLCEFDKEQAVWERILKIQHQFYSEQHPALANTHYDYSSLFLRKGEYNKAAQHVLSSLQITEHNFGKIHADYFGSLVRLAICRYEQQEYSLAQDILDDAKKLQPKIFGDPFHPYVARMLQLQSEILRRQGNFNAALEVIDQAIAIKKVIYGTEEHPSVAEAFEMKVKIFHHLGERVEAKLLIDRTLEIRRKAYGENHPEVGRSYHDLGSYHLRLGQFEAAAEQFERARQITAIVFGKGHPDYVERTLNLANARNEHGEYELALELMAEIEGVLPNGNHYLTARWLQLKGELQRRMGQFNIAMDYIDKAIAMKKLIYGSENHPSVAEALEVQAKIYDHRCEFDKEQAVWERILEIQRQFYAEQHPALANTHYNYSSLFLRKGEYDKAAEHLQLSLQITEQNFRRTHAGYFRTLVRLATCYYEQQKYSQAQKILDDAKKLRPGTFGDSFHPYIARMLQLQSNILRRQGQFNEALEVINQAIEMKKKIYGKEDHPSVTEAMEVKADLRLNQYQIQECGEVLDKVQRVWHSAYGDNHPAYANYQIRRAEWYLIMDLYEEAKEVLTQALQTCLKTLSPDHPSTLRCQIMLAQLARMSDDIVEAETIINSVIAVLDAKPETADSLTVASAFQELSNIKRAQGNYRDALKELDKALEARINIFGISSPAVIELQYQRAKLLTLFRRLTEADDVIENALRLAVPNQPIYKRLRSDLLDQRGILQIHKGEYDQAIENIEEGISLKGEVLGNDHVELARLYVDKAVALRHVGKYDEALVSLEKAHNINNQHLHFGEYHVFFARILLERGQTHLDRKSILEARQDLEEALEIYDTKRRRNVRERAVAVQALGRLYLQNGNTLAAAERFDEALEIRMAIYGSSHPEIAETLYDQGKVLLRISEACENEDSKIGARQKLEQALNMLRQYGDNYVELISDIEHTLSNLQ